MVVIFVYVTTLTATYLIYGLKARCHWASLGEMKRVEFVENALFDS